jgi:hypothetical protein
MAKPVSLTHVDESDYTGAYAPEPLVIVGDVPASEAVQGIATVATPDATDAASAATLANALKARLNALITALKS